MHQLTSRGNNWLPTLTTYKVQSLVLLLPTKVKVNELIDHDTKIWKWDLISLIFTKDETQTICCLPLPLFGAPDRLTWWPTKNRYFSVKSTYFLKLQRTKKEEGGSSHGSTSDSLWTKLWRLRIPHTVKYFV